MKYGMNMLLWTTDVTEEHYGILQQLKGFGYDGVELPIFDISEEHFKTLGAKLDEIGLERTAVTVCTAEANPIAESAEVRQAGLNHIKQAVDIPGIHYREYTLECKARPVSAIVGDFGG